MNDIFIILLSFALTLGCTFGVMKMLVARSVLDHPNERSSHKTPVPRGGGWALLAVLIPGMLLGGYAFGSVLPHLGLLVGALTLAFVSWLDDKKGLSASIRLLVHILAAFLGSMSFPIDDLIFGGALPFWLDRAVMIIGWAWFMNVYNFMDGIDGITCTETILLALGACLVMTALNTPDPFASVAAKLLMGACLGFLAFNWHPAKIFMGDVGSIPLGYLTGFLLLTLATKGQLIPALILPLYYVADSGITLTKRILRGEKIWQAHRQHFYQTAALARGRHDKVVFLVAAADIGLNGSALGAVTRPWAWLAVAIVIVAILLMKLHKSSAATG